MTLQRQIIYPVPGEEGARARGSDLRQNAPVHGVCALCLADTRLLLSHIVPKWAFRWMKAEGGVYNRTTGIMHRMQDGAKHYLLCSNCEQYLGIAENYLRLVTTGGPAELRSNQLELRVFGTDFIRLIGMDFALVCRGLLGLVLKQHYAKSSPQVVPTENAIGLIRDAILRDEYCAMPAQLIGIKWMGDGTIGNPRAHSSVVIDREATGAIFARCGLAGVDWQIILTETPHFHDDGVWWPPRGSFAVGHLRERAPWFPDFESWEPNDGEFESVMGTPPTDPCPCGSGLATKGCCQDTWIAAWRQSAPRSRLQFPAPRDSTTP